MGFFFLNTFCFSLILTFEPMHIRCLVGCLRKRFIDFVWCNAYFSAFSFATVALQWLEKCGKYGL